MPRQGAVGDGAFSPIRRMVILSWALSSRRPPWRMSPAVSSKALVKRPGLVVLLALVMRTLYPREASRAMFARPVSRKKRPRHTIRRAKLRMSGRGRFGDAQAAGAAGEIRWRLNHIIPGGQYFRLSRMRSWSLPCRRILQSSPESSKTLSAPEGCRANNRFHTDRTITGRTLLAKEGRGANVHCANAG